MDIVEQQEETTEEQAAEETPQEVEAKYSQADLDRIAGKTREEERRKYERQKEEGERKAREDALKEQEKFKELAEERGNDLAELATRAETVEGERDTWKEKAESYEEILNAQWEARKDGIPDYVLDAISERSLTDRLKYLDQHAEKFNVAAPNGKPAGSRPTGRPAAPARQESDKEAREAQRLARVSAI